VRWRDDDRAAFAGQKSERLLLTTLATAVLGAPSRVLLRWRLRLLLGRFAAALLLRCTLLSLALLLLVH
jgi:hypothetical protein